MKWQTFPPAPDTAAYRQLQQHLDTLPIGFPASGSGADLRLLARIFTPRQAGIACCLSQVPRSLAQIFERARHLVQDPAALAAELSAMVRQGGLEVRQQEGQTLYANTPLVVGMYEFQVNRLTPEFIQDFKAYTSEKSFGIAFLSTALSQMRTIPIGKSLTPELPVAGFDNIDQIMARARPPFAILPCICRKKKEALGGSCRQTGRNETCLAMGQVGYTVLKMGIGRQIEREEARSILDQNQKEGLVLQPSNTREPEFICSCCGCCCGMLSLQKDLPLPLDFWAANFRAVLDTARCRACGLCVSLCQTGALTLVPEKTDRPEPVLEALRCIGCGLCVPRCPGQALALVQVPHPSQPPLNRDALYQELATKHRGIAKARAVAKLACGMVRTRDLRLLKADAKD